MADVPEPSPLSGSSCLLTAWRIDKGLYVMPLESLLGVSTLHCELGRQHSPVDKVQHL